jgi:ribose-phosphate pyrophosphokinase
MLTVFSDNVQIETNYLKFSDGAITYKLDTLPENPRYITINVDPRTPVNEIREELTVLLDAIGNFYQTSFCYFDTRKVLNIPYLPYARADRCFEKGNPEALNTFLHWVHSLQFDEVIARDVHNEESLSGFIVKSLPQLKCFLSSTPHTFQFDYDFVVAPDKGAMIKATTIADHHECDIVFAGKTRDVSTGSITAFTLPDIDFEGRKVLIPDDICDGNYTFYGLAKELKARGASQVDLYVTHMIGSKGLVNLEPYVDKIYYYHIVGGFLNGDDINAFNNRGRSLGSYT